VEIGDKWVGIENLCASPRKFCVVFAAPELLGFTDMSYNLNTGVHALFDSKLAQLLSLII